MIATFAACGNSGQQTTSTAANAAKQTISAFGSEPADLLTTNVGGTESSKVLGLLYSGLTAFNAKGQVVNEVADSIKANDDSTKYTITLKDGWKFTDGTPVTAQSFTKAWSYGANVTNAQLCASYFSDIKGYDELQTKGVDANAQLSGLTVVNDHEFTVELNAPSSVFPVKIGYIPFAPQPESFFSDPKSFKENPIGNGAYKLKQWTHSQSIALEPNPDYKGNFPAKNGGVTFQLYTDAQAAYADVEAGNLDILENVPASASKLFQTDTKLQAFNEGGAAFATFAIPGRLAHFSGKEGQLRRQALSYAVNRDALTTKILNGLGTPATDFVAPAIPGHSNDLKGKSVLTYDPDKAKQLWAEADAISPWEGTFKIAYNADSATKKAIFEAVLNSIKNTLGIDTATNPIPTAQEFGSLVNGRTIDTPFSMSWAPDYPSIENYLQPLYSTAAAKTGLNQGDYSNAQVDDLLSKAAKESNTDKAQSYYQQAEEILLEELPVIPLYYQNATAVAAKGVSGVELGWQGLPVYQNITK